MWIYYMKSNQFHHFLLIKATVIIKTKLRLRQPLTQPVAHMHRTRTTHTLRTVKCVPVILPPNSKLLTIVKQRCTAEFRKIFVRFIYEFVTVELHIQFLCSNRA